MNKLSIVIICKNEQHNIRRCLESIKWADEIVVYDTGSTDGTLDICKEYNTNIYTGLSCEDGFGKAKRDAVNHAKNDWIFVIDADEEISEKLRQRLLLILSSPDSLQAYKIKTNSFFLGKEIKHSGWQKEYHLRFFNRQYGNYNDKKVHESIEVNTPIGRIEEVLYHYTYPSITTQMRKLQLYGQLHAEQCSLSKKKAGICSAFFHALGKFIKMYMFNAGFLDGKVGFILAINSSFGVWLKYILYWEKVTQNVKPE